LIVTNTGSPCTAGETLIGSAIEPPSVTVSALLPTVRVGACVVAGSTLLLPVLPLPEWSSAGKLVARFQLKPPEAPDPPAVSF